MTNPMRRSTDEDRASGSGSRATPGETRPRHGTREAGRGDRHAGSDRGQVRQSAAASSFPLDYRFSVL